MSLKSYFNPELVKKFSSKFNSDIEIVRFMGEYRLDMGGLTQSGEIVSRIWDKAFNDLLPRQFKPENILILGLGGGAAATLLSRRFSKAKITGIEIDPVVIKIGKEFFKLGKIKALKVINKDAIKFVKKLPSQSHYDLILIDCYQGFKSPKEFSDPKFLLNLCQKGTFVLLNRLNWDEHEINTHLFLDNLANNFNIKPSKTFSNLVISLSPKI